MSNTIFMGPRTNYVLWRYQLHAAGSVAALVCVIVGVACSVYKPAAYGGLLPCVAVVTKKGRKISRQCVKEVHDGILFKMTGVFETDSKKTSRK